MSGFQSNGSHTYFVYGSNMNPAQVADRCGSPELLGVARVAGHSLAFFGHLAMWDGAEETVVPQAGGEVWGVLYRLSFSEADRFDERQGVRTDGAGPFFLFPVFAVDLQGVSHAALLYKKSFCGEPGLPSDAQRDNIVVGARAQGVPAAYVEHLQGLPAKKASYPVPRVERRWFGLFPSTCRACG